MKTINTETTVKAHQKVLYNHFITEDQPGTILRDFDTLLHIVRDAQPLKVTSSNNLPPMNMLPAINEQLVNPIRLDFKRPQHKSFPNILGLFLLLRATGLAFVDGSGKTNRLVIDEDILQPWNSLNPTERYFTLLETALLWAEPSIIGEEGGGRWYHPLYRWNDLLHNIPETGLEIAGNPSNADRLKTIPGFYNLALMQMFGFITIHDDAPVSGKGWNIIAIRKHAFGEAVMEELADIAPTLENDFWLDEEFKKETSFGELQPRFQPFFPEWEHNLEVPGYESLEGVYVFKVTVWKNVWRRIAISGDLMLDRLSDTILNAFKFDNDHLYRFIYIDRFGIERHIDHPMLYEGRRHDEDLPLLTNAARIRDVPLRLGTSMIFYFDFGDQWEFEVLLEEIAPPELRIPQSKILEKHGTAPKQYGW